MICNDILKCVIKINESEYVFVGILNDIYCEVCWKESEKSLSTSVDH